MHGARRIAVLGLLAAVGAAADDFQAEIVNGDPVPPSSPIARATVRIENKDEACSAVLIDWRWVATAAHCATRDPARMSGTASPASVHVFFGGPRAPRRRADRVVLHPRFAGRDGIYGPQRHDVALVRFSGGVPDGFAPARFLHEPDAPLAEGAAVVLAGYGVDRPGRTPDAPRLRSFATRVSELRPDTSVVQLRPFPGRPGGSCQGDSGGPAFAKDGDDDVLWGVASAASKDCATLAQYEDLRRYRAWIATQVGEPESAAALDDGTAAR